MMLETDAKLCQRRKGEVGNGRGVSLPSRLVIWVNFVNFPSGIWAPATKALWQIFGCKNSSYSIIATIFTIFMHERGV